MEVRSPGRPEIVLRKPVLQIRVSRNLLQQRQDARGCLNVHVPDRRDVSVRIPMNGDFRHTIPYRVLALQCEKVFIFPIL